MVDADLDAAERSCASIRQPLQTLLCVPKTAAYCERRGIMEQVMLGRVNVNKYLGRKDDEIKAAALAALDAADAKLVEADKPLPHLNPKS